MKARNLLIVREFMVAGLVILAWAQTAEAAVTRAISFGISERLRPDNSFYYTLGVGDYPFPPSDFSDKVEQYVLPNGEVFDRANGIDRFAASLDFDTFNELAHAIVGQWQFNTAESTNPLDVETYSFTVQPFQLSDITDIRPDIYEPANGAYIDLPFQVRWDPSITSYELAGYGVTGGFDLVAPGVLNLNFQLSPLEPDPYITFEITDGNQSLAPFISSIAAPNDPEFNLTVRSAFARIANITVYPRTVPEPMAISIALMSLSCIIFVRWFQ